MLTRLQSDWPFQAARTPFYYGWVIAVISTLGILASVPGQTMGMAVFADTFITQLDLSRTELSTAYLIGTVGSALILPRTGRWYDRFGPRSMLVTAACVLAVMVCFISFLDLLGRWVAAQFSLTLATVTFPLIMIGFFGVRLAGQGILTSASRNVLLVWFERRRGLVSGVRGVFVSLGFSLAPLFIALLIGVAEWRGALWWLALMVAAFAVLALVFVRDRPAVSGLKIDGQVSATEDVSQDKEKSRPLPERDVFAARRDPVFWLYTGALAMHGLFGTAVTFHIIAIFEAADRTAEQAFAYFLPQAMVSVAMNLVASSLADTRRLKPFLCLMLVMFLLGTWGILRLETEWGYWLLVVGFGAGGGLWGMLSNLVFIRQFGALHLGGISGLSTATTVFASAIGPVAFSLANDAYATFNAAAYVCGAVLSGLLLAAVLLPQPYDRKPEGP